MKPRFKALFTDHPSHEAITELLDCLQTLDDACNARHLSQILRDNPKQPDLAGPTHSQTTPPEQ
jgi:hypothetical protein